MAETQNRPGIYMRKCHFLTEDSSVYPLLPPVHWEDLRGNWPCLGCIYVCLVACVFVSCSMSKTDWLHLRMKSSGLCKPLQCTPQQWMVLQIHQYNVLCSINRSNTTQNSNLSVSRDNESSQHCSLSQQIFFLSRRVILLCADDDGKNLCRESKSCQKPQQIWRTLFWHPFIKLTLLHR